MIRLEAYFHGSYRGLRAYLLSKVFLAMVALDTWMLMLGHAGRYGVAGFNVAHFTWLDRLGPVPSPALYVGVLLLTGLLALSLALLGVSTWAMTALFLLYTYSWAMSMLDSYQHHYFVSLVMLCLIFFPPLRAADVLKKDQPQLTQGFGYNLLGATICILYTFTAVAKMDAQWCQGYTLQRISTSAQVFAPILSLADSLGFSAQQTWAIVSTSVIPLELSVALAYALAVCQDVSRSRALRLFVNVGFVLALSLHLGAEALGLDIGWFSYYMLALACTYLAPGRALDLLGQLLARPARAVASFMSEPGAGPKSRFEVLITTAAASCVLAGAAYLLDLPGATGAATTAVVALWVSVAFSRKLARGRDPAHVALGAGVAAVLMWVAIARSEVRWDYYRFLGGDLQRRGEKQAALDAYVKGERYAPAGSSRRDKIKQLQRELAR